MREASPPPFDELPPQSRPAGLPTGEFLSHGFDSMPKGECDPFLQGDEMKIVWWLICSLSFFFFFNEFYDGMFDYRAVCSAMYNKKKKRSFNMRKK